MGGTFIFSTFSSWLFLCGLHTTALGVCVKLKLCVGAFLGICELVKVVQALVKKETRIKTWALTLSMVATRSRMMVVMCRRMIAASTNIVAPVRTEESFPMNRMM